MPGLYGITGNANVAVYNTPGLYINSGASPILTNAQQLLALLSSDGTVIFQLDPATGYSTVQAFANVSGNTGGGSYVTLVGNVTGNGAVGLPITTTLSSTGVTPGTYGSNSNIPIVTIDYQGRVTGVSVGNVANYLPGDPTIASIQSNIVILQSEVYTNANAQAFVNSYLPNYLPSYLGSYTGNITSSNSTSINSTVTNFNVLGNATVQQNLIVYGNVIYSNSYVTTTTYNSIIANASTPSTTANSGAIISYGGLGVFGNINAGGLINANGNITTQQYMFATNYLYPNGTPILTSVNANIQTLNSNTASLAASINTLNANVGAYEIWANAAISNITTNANANTSSYLLGNTIQGNIQANIITVGPYGSVGGNLPVASGILKIEGAYGSLGQGPALTLTASRGHDSAGFGYSNIASIVQGAGFQAVGSYGQINLFGNIITPSGIFAGNTTRYNNINLFENYLSTITQNQPWASPAAVLEGNVFINDITQATTYINGQTYFNGGNVTLATTLTNLILGGNTYTQGGGGAGNIYMGGNTAIYGNLYLYANGTPILSSIITSIQSTNSNVQTLSANLGAFETYANATFSTGGSSNYGNANVAAYLSSGVLNSNIITGANVIAGSVLSNNHLYANGVPILNSVNTSIQTLSANLGAFETYANATFSTGGGSSYGNANVAAYFASGNVNTNIITTANISATYFTGNGYYLSGVTTGGSGNYGNANVAAYLASGTVNTNIITTANVNAGNVNATGTFYGNLIAANVLVANIGIQNYTTYNTVTTPGYSKGVLWYDSVQDSLDYFNSVTNNEINIGQELQFNAYNGTGVTITQGTPVYLTGGSVGTTPNIAPAIANTIATSQVAGVANQAIPTGTVGCVVTVGIVANVAMGAYSVGDTLYLSPYSAGQVQNTQPPTGYVCKIGTVIYNNSPNGTFLVNKTVPINNQYYGNLTLTGNLTANNATVTNKITAGSLTVSGGINGTLNTSNQPNITTVGILTGLNLGGGLTSNSDIYTTGNITSSVNPVQASGYLSNGSYPYSYTSPSAVFDWDPPNSNVRLSATTTGSGYAFYTGGLGNTKIFGIDSNGNVGAAGGAVFNGNINTTGNVVATGSLIGKGVFYANGTPIGVSQIIAGSNVSISPSSGVGAVTISITGGGGGFSGNLTGAILYDSINQRIFANAYPLSTPTASSATVFNSGWTNNAQYAPVYTNGVLQLPAVNQYPYSGFGLPSTTYGLVQSSNVAVQSSYQTSQNRNAIGALFYQQVWPYTANTMTTQDRIRGSSSLTELMLNGYTWGSMTSSSQNATSVTNVGGSINVTGSGNVGAMVGTSSALLLSPSGTGSANIQYATAYVGSMTIYGNTSSFVSNVTYFRTLAPFISTSGSPNYSITNAVGLHTYSGWASPANGTGSVTNRYVVLNEDSTTAIQTNGNLTVSNASVNSTTTISSKNINIGNSGIPIVNIGTINASTVTIGATGGTGGTIALNGNTTQSSSNTFFAVSNYAAATLRAFTGAIGQMAAVSDNGGQIAYWDTNNSRWSYINGGGAV